MRRGRVIWSLAAISLTLSAAAAFKAFGPTGSNSPAQPMAKGFVFHDRNNNGSKDAGEPGLPGVRVSNQREIVKTDRSGAWSLPYDQDTTFFVIKPRGWRTPLDENNLPEFYYTHKPGGSPATQYRGVSPTGPLPNSIDFPLIQQREPDKFKALMFGDPQPRNVTEVDYVAHDVVEDLIGYDAAFGVTLGDIAFDNLDTFEPLNRVIAMIGIPWYNVLGNHDINYDSPNDQLSDETFERVYGPNYYSFDYGPTHFIVLDDVRWSGRTASDRGRYTGGLGPEQLEFVKNDLALIPKDQLVVLMMHIPLVNVEDRQELYRLIEQRPYALSISAHTHYLEHRFIDEQDGWRGAKPHHHVINVTVCGSWWQGAPDERGIPHTTMRDGAPNGYSIFTFDGRSYDIEFRAARRPADNQMNIIAPFSVKAEEAGQTQITVNVFNGSKMSKTEMRVGKNGQWVPMKYVLKHDPEYAAAVERDKGLTAPYRPLPGPENSTHLWEAMLPANLPKGLQPIYVRTTDMHGKSYEALRSIRVE